MRQRPCMTPPHSCRATNKITSSNQLQHALSETYLLLCSRWSNVGGPKNRKIRTRFQRIGTHCSRNPPARWAIGLHCRSGPTSRIECLSGAVGTLTRSSLLVLKSCNDGGGENGGECGGRLHKVFGLAASKAGTFDHDKQSSRGIIRRRQRAECIEPEVNKHTQRSERLKHATSASKPVAAG